MNIQKDPPKAVWTKKRDKVSDTQEITRMIGEDGGDRICEMIKVYPRGINPHVSVSYSNYGTNGGQYRGGTLAGVMGNNKACNDGRSALMGQAKLPYQLLDNGAFRPPIMRQEDLMPLSRQPRSSTHVWTKKGFVNYLSNPKCPSGKKMRQIQEPIHTSIRPTAIIDIQKPLVEPFVLRQVIDNPIKVQVSSGIRTMDRVQRVNSDVNGRVKDALIGNIRTNQGLTHIGNKSVQDINPNKYVADITYTNMSINKGKNVSLPMEEQKGNLSVKYNPINYSTTSGISIPNAGPLMDNVPHDLSRPVPSHKMNANRSANIYIQQKEQKKIPLERNRPLTSVKTSLGQSYGSDTYSVSSRDKKLKYTIRPQGGMSGRGTKVKIEMDRNTQFKSSQNKMNIIKQSNVTQGFRNQ
ncbi:MAG TPA: hypothetical protein EYO58_10015 [Flavobacteriales bacterium]|nr:hypothetical protein [Flavobacteriales bacterium]